MVTGYDMGQLGFFNVDDRYDALDAKGDPLAKLDQIIPWEQFRPQLEAVWATPEEERKSPAGRKPWDAIVIFKGLILGVLYNLSDEQIEYQIRDRLSFSRFCGTGIEGRVPDATTFWLYREQLTRAGAIAELFQAFDHYLASQGYRASGGQIVDASIVSVPIQRNSRRENESLKQDLIPSEWVFNPAKLAQKDLDARWTKKHGKSHYGYKNHITIDRRHKLVRSYAVTDAAVHDSQVIDQLLDSPNTSPDVWADRAYRSRAIEAMLTEKGLTSRIHRKAAANRPLTAAEEAVNRGWSQVRARVEHIFGSQTNEMGGTHIRTIGVRRAVTQIGFKNLAYNIRRLAHLEHRRTAAAA